MKCLIPEISWHNRDPVFSVDLQPVAKDFYRLASGGGDCHVVIWQIKSQENGNVDIEVIAELTRHQRTVNCVRWSPSGQYLASCDDDSNIIVWHCKAEGVPVFDENPDDKENWVVFKVLRGHKEDVYDISWSPDETKLLTGSIDNTAIIWDFSKGRIEHILKDHKGFVQGVTWDPKNEFIATACSDRVCRVFTQNGKSVITRIYRGQVPVSEDSDFYKKEVKYFHDDTFKSYFRRLHFSPDGSLLVVPAGCIETEDCKNALNATYIFNLDVSKEPIAVLPSGKQSTVAVRFCPVLLELRPDGPDPLIVLPYRMVFAVATDTDIILYDTQQSTPIAYYQKIHYTRLTDLSWSPDGLILIASSTDGFCTIVTFEANELGDVHIKKDEEVESSILDISGCEELEKEDDDEKQKEVVVSKKPTILEKWTIKTPKKIKLDSAAQGTDKKKGKIDDDDVIILENNIDNKKPTCASFDVNNSINRLTPKRVTPITIPNAETNTESSPKPQISSAKPIAVRRKPRLPESPQSSSKNNSLLNFLKPKSAQKSQKEKISSDPIVIADDEANDAWKCQNENVVLNNEIIEDSLENFKLEYSNTQVAVDDTEMETKENVEELSTKENNISESNVALNETEKAEKSENNSNGTQICDLGDSEIKEISDKDKSTQEVPKGVENSLQQKIPRRVPLITLSSPKSKKI